MPANSLSTKQPTPDEINAEKSTSYVDSPAMPGDSERSVLQDPVIIARLDNFAEQLAKIESTLAALVQQKTLKEWYTTAEVAEMLKKAEYTVREWCRQGRIKARKKPCGRGKNGEWLICHEEFIRIRNEGILPLYRFTVT